MHSGEKNRLLNDVPPYPGISDITAEEANNAKIMNKTQAYRNRRTTRGIGIVTLSMALGGGLFVRDNMQYVVGTRETLAPVAESCEGAPEKLLELARNSDASLSEETVSKLRQIESENKQTKSAATRFRPYSQLPQEVTEDPNRPPDILLVPWNFRHWITSLWKKAASTYAY